MEVRPLLDVTVTWPVKIEETAVQMFRSIVQVPVRDIVEELAHPVVVSVMHTVGSFHNFVAEILRHNVQQNLQQEVHSPILTIFKKKFKECLSTVVLVSSLITLFRTSDDKFAR